MFRAGAPADIETILPMMEDFYVFEKIPYDASRSRRLLHQLVDDPRLGRLIVFERNKEIVGYLVLGFGFSLEFGGIDALLDEFYVRPEFRGRAIGRAALEFACDLCRDLGIRALHLEADTVNTRVHEFYLRSGFRDHPRHLMTRWL